MTLYHYTCDHGREALADGGNLLALAFQMPEIWRRNGITRTHALQYSLVWVTDLPEPDIAGLGLTRKTIRCERWRYRYRVTDESTCRAFALEQHRFPMDAQKQLLADGAMPQHWWVSWRPVPVVFDPIEKKRRGK